MFRIEWADKALDELATLWSAAPRSFRSPISAAVHDLDIELARSADTAGESRATMTLRVAYAAPLGISYEVDSVKRTVLVDHVWFCPPPRS